MQKRSSRRGNQVEIPGVRYKVGKESVQYRGPVIWNFFNKIVNLNLSETTKKDRFKQMLGRFSKDIKELSFKAYDREEK